MRKIQLSILELLGNLDQKLCFAVVPDQDDCIAQSALAWDTEKHVKFSMPFQQIKLDIYLGKKFFHGIVSKSINFICEIKN